MQVLRAPDGFAQPCFSALGIAMPKHAHRHLMDNPSIAIGDRLMTNGKPEIPPNIPPEVPPEEPPLGIPADNPPEGPPEDPPLGIPPDNPPEVPPQEDNQAR